MLAVIRDHRSEIEGGKMTKHEWRTHARNRNRNRVRSRSAIGRIRRGES